MDKHRNTFRLSKFLLLSLPLIYGSSLYAAKPVDLLHQNVSLLQTFSNASSAATNGSQLIEVSRGLDFNQTLHVRVKQTYQGFPVWGSDGVVHIPHGAKTATTLADVLAAANSNHGTMNGTFYQNLTADLGTASPLILSAAQANKAQQIAINDHSQKVGKQLAVSEQQTQLMIYVDNHNKAHWAYQITFLTDGAKAGDIPARPIYIIDATSLTIYDTWNNIQTLDDPKLNPNVGGGFGGNEKMGELTYDGLPGDLARLNIRRDHVGQLCYLENAQVLIKRCTKTVFGNCYQSDTANFSCTAKDPNHNNVFWSGDSDAVNGGYSPDNDALFAGKVIKNMYQDWYGIPVLKNKDGTPLLLTMLTHIALFDNAFWDPMRQTMNFGDGETMFYPLTSLGVGAHEISHGFTSQHSNLTYRHQSGGMNEAFSDMAANAAEFYAYGKSSWQIGAEIMKKDGASLRYMDQPSKDCNGKNPGDHCSIDNASEYTDSLDVHYASGVYNRLFYLMGTAPGWDARKAFDVMVQANANYWVASSDYTKGACGILSATKDLGYDVATVTDALTQVGIDSTGC